MEMLEPNLCILTFLSLYLIYNVLNLLLILKKCLFQQLFVICEKGIV